MSGSNKRNNYMDVLDRKAQRVARNQVRESKSDYVFEEELDEDLEDIADDLPANVLKQINKFRSK